MSKVLVVLLLLSGCKWNSTSESEKHDFDSLVSVFVSEASKRGVKLNIQGSGLSIQFGKIEGKKSGSCKPNLYPKIITIDSITWKYINSAQRESLLFHELAHCLLKREHFNESFEFGECKSWMREEESKCNTNLQNLEWRQYYLDELFTPGKVQVPHWYNPSQKYHDTDNLPITRDVRLKPLVYHSLDSIFSNSYNWIFNVKCSQPARPEFPSTIGVVVNEYAIEASFRKIAPYSPDPKIRPALVILSTYPKKVVLDATSESEAMELSFQKFDNTLYIYFDKTLKYCIPIASSEAKIGGYCSFPMEHYSINFYDL